MAPRPKATVKHVAAFSRRKDFLTELLSGPMSVLVIQAQGDLAFARSLATDGFISLGADICTIAPTGREWLKEIAR